MIGRMKTCLAAILFTALLPSALASAQTMEFACPDPGTTFTYDSGTKVVARGRDGMDCNMEIVGGKPYKLRALLFDNPAPDGSNVSAFLAALRPERLWPLQVGKKIEADFSSGGRSWHYILTVARYEKRAGPGDALIDTFVVEMNEQGNKGERAISRWWIAPADKYAIRFDFSDGAGKANRALVSSVSR
jgi:Protein of unknown function (DUF3108)